MQNSIKQKVLCIIGINNPLTSYFKRIQKLHNYVNKLSCFYFDLVSCGSDFYFTGNNGTGTLRN